MSTAIPDLPIEAPTPRAGALRQLAVGPWKTLLDDFSADHPERLVYTTRRTWDKALWPNAKADFFKFKSKLPALLDTLI